MRKFNYDRLVEDLNPNPDCIEQEPGRYLLVCAGIIDVRVTTAEDIAGINNYFHLYHSPWERQLVAVYDLDTGIALDFQIQMTINLETGGS